MSRIVRERVFSVTSTLYFSKRNKYVQIYVKPVGVISVDFIGDGFSSTVTI